MPKFFSLEKPKKEKVEEINQELKEFPELKPRLTFNFPLNENRRSALEMINREQEVDSEKIMQLIQSRDFVERNAGLYLISQKPDFSEEDKKEILQILDGMVQDRDEDVKKVALRAKVNLVLMAQDEESLEKISKDKDWMVRRAVVQVLGNFGDKYLPILERISKDDKDLYVKELARAQVLINRGEKSLPTLEKMSRDKHFSVRESAIEILGQIGKKSLPILEQMMLKEEIDHLKDLIHATLNNLSIPSESFRKWLFATQKPLFATPFTKELSEKIIALENISQLVKDKFGDKFIGLTIFGSMSKGYANKKSDLDWGFIAENKEAAECFNDLVELSPNLRPCDWGRYSVGLGAGDPIEQHQDALFYGLFFGDRKQLLKLQKEVLNNISEEDWDKIRKHIMEHETNLDKIAHRVEIKNSELEQIRQISALLRVPLSYNETLKMFESK